MLSIKNLTKSYKTKTGRHYVFRNVSIDFPENKNIGILGLNGSGKSTLLRILGGIDHPDSGTIHCDKTISWPLGLRGGFVGNLSGRDNCQMICNLYGIDRQLIRTKLNFIKELSGIGQYFDEPVKYFSSGMGSRLGFALSMAFDFDILLMDEITSVGDQYFRKKAKQMIDSKRDHTNIIFVSHSATTVREFCDVGVIIRKGALEYYDDINNAFNAYQ
jgi:capsular polysaccharide transport system ATP-binding protein